MNVNTTDDSWGQVYVFNHPRMPGLVKIGFSHQPIRQRICDLRSAGLPGDFVLVHSRYCFDPRAVERQIHEALAEKRVLKDKEFFELSETEAITVVDSYVDGVVVPINTPISVNSSTVIFDTIRTQRLALGITQQELSKKAGISRTTMTKLENGKFREGVSLDVLMRVLGVLGLELTINTVKD